MISRSASLTIASAYTEIFSYRSSGSAQRSPRDHVYCDRLYDYFYEREYEAWFCNFLKGTITIRGLKEKFLQIHTGESFVKATPNWPWQKRQQLGQRYLRDLARDYLRWYQKEKTDRFFKEVHHEYYRDLLRKLEIDGYSFKDNDLYQLEIDILDVDEEKGLLGKLYNSISLGRKSDAFEFLKLSESHYINGNWADCIANSRKFLELTLQEGASALANKRNISLTTRQLERPVEIRQFLENQNILEHKERESLDKIYGLLSHTGSHPYMAEKDQARLLRQLSLTISQFVLLRLEGALL